MTDNWTTHLVRKQGVISADTAINDYNPLPSHQQLPSPGFFPRLIRLKKPETQFIKNIQFSPWLGGLKQKKPHWDRGTNKSFVCFNPPGLGKNKLEF